MLTRETLVTQRTVVEMGALARNHGLPVNNRRQRDLIASRLYSVGVAGGAVARRL